jgi:hypothetical protein
MRKLRRRRTDAILQPPAPSLEIVAPYREDLVVAAECMFPWYWLADVCAAEGITFVLGHALAMTAIHGGKSKNDKIDSHKIASLLPAVCCLSPTFIRPRCDRRGIYCDGDCTWCRSGSNQNFACLPSGST